MDFVGVSAQVFSELIGAIYDCALDPQQWLTTCRKIADLCDSTAAGICVHDLQHAHNDELFVTGYDPHFLHTLASHYADSPMAVADVVATVGDVAALSMERFHLHDSRFFRDVMAPFGVADIVWFPALRTAGRMASMHASRIGVHATPYQQRELELFKLLAPHVCRALAISDALDLRALKSEALEQTLDNLGAGVYLVTREGRVVFMNEAAQVQVRSARSVRLVDHRLAPVHVAAAVALSRAIAEAGLDGAAAKAAGQYIAMPDGIGGGYVATVLPIDSGHRSGVLAPFAASIAVFVQDPITAPFMPGEAFARLHGLTGGELRVLLALSQGLGGREAADMLGITEPTLRTHLQRTYAKTGTSRQAELLRLFRNSAPPTRLQRLPGKPSSPGGGG